MRSHVIPTGSGAALRIGRHHVAALLIGCTGCSTDAQDLTSRHVGLSLDGSADDATDAVGQQLTRRQEAHPHSGPVTVLATEQVFQRQLPARETPV